MSHLSAPTVEYDFWDFVNCTRCHTRFVSASPEVPFWITECGHVVCNNHLNADQSCPQCGAQNIQMMQLQREMEAPVSEWFRSVPVALDGIAFAAKLQQETLANQIRFLNSKLRQYKEFISRLRHEASELKKTNEDLNTQNAELRGRFGYQRNSGERDGGQEPSTSTNFNGKRRMTQTFQHDSRQSTTSSSPRLITTPLGPNRLTALPGQQPPELSSNAQNNSRSTSYGHEGNNSSAHHMTQRPGSSLFAEQYAYAPPPSAGDFHPMVSHAQSAPRQFVRANTAQNSVFRAMLPPPVPSARVNTIQGRQDLGSTHTLVHQNPQGRVAIGPPPTPRPHQQQAVVHPVPARPMQSAALDVNSQTQRSAILVATPSNNQQTRRFVAPTPSTDPRRFKPAPDPGARGTSHATSSGGNRLPFVTGTQGGFG